MRIRILGWNVLNCSPRSYETSWVELIQAIVLCLAQMCKLALLRSPQTIIALDFAVKEHLDYILHSDSRACILSCQCHWRDILSLQEWEVPFLSFCSWSEEREGERKAVGCPHSEMLPSLSREELCREHPTPSPEPFWDHLWRLNRNNSTWPKVVSVCKSKAHSRVSWKTKKIALV